MPTVVIFKLCSCRKKEHSMDKNQAVLDSFDKQAKSKTSTSKKRKWREIEQLKERFQLEKELRIYDDSLEYMLDEF
ncbi:MAG: hypothetical protein CL811_05910 [Colwelliaceae bacterium]|nr:hypothetical protein [Colwelliaceae bacterium]